MNVDHCNQISDKNISKVNIVITDVHDGQKMSSNCMQKMTQLNKLVFLVNENGHLQYYTIGYLSISSLKQKTLKVDQQINVWIGFGIDQLQKCNKTNFISTNCIISFIFDQHNLIIID
ncbi:hypothetical protein LOAG_09262 [Loa loa]|uniref:Uncharacterized protein n=1 Tax=Loa loa TaxID=7209 RepID=A0A1S0TS95_LOALO|nr:hypothetical protein LOAG_09262 [Loa loa]EFO19234.1 hypothetical protein LOAG_09262 [Loa loa]